MKSALITGASSGIGAATAVEFARHGLDVLLVARRADKLAGLAQRIQDLGARAFCFPTDLSQSANTQDLVARVTREYGIPDILVNNAGIGWYGYFSEMPEPVMRDMLMVNIYASVYLTRLFLPEFIKRNSGHIINIGSIAGGFPNQGVALYSSTKAFLDAFTTSLYRELRRTGVQISVVRAGPVKTEFYSSAKKLQNGGVIPAERFGISAEAIGKRVWSLVCWPRKVTYIPRFLAVTPWIESFFGWIIDRLGPLLLEKRK